MLVLWHCMHMCMHTCWCLLLLIHNTWLSQHLIYDTSTIIHEDNEEKPGGPEPQCLPGLKRHWDLAAHSASITHTETEGKITKAYSNSRYTSSGLELYSTRENRDKPDIQYVSPYSKQGWDKGLCILGDAKQPKVESSPHVCMHLFAYPTDNVIRPLSMTIIFVGALPQHLVDTKVVS